ncbi:EamA family transporter [Solimonas aquatica]|uniref:EamA family transporter n=1 Tax=Solimonas aquatica TaxID=489703 RepID=UPI000B812AB2|nr:EamA family transporter [Solimonas aquatica]
MSSASRKTQLWLAFATIYLVWGSTYLAIRIGVHEAPPMLLAGLRFALASPLMVAYALWRGDRFPRARRDYLIVASTGILMLVGGNGLVTWAEQWVASGQTALIVATSALWIAWFGSFGSKGVALNVVTVLGLLLGFAGVALLVGDGLHATAAPAAAYVALVISPIAWAAGSILSLRYPLSCGPMMAAALQSSVGAVVLCGAGLLHGDAQRWVWTPAVLGSVLYLAVFGSFVAYNAYYWLVHATTPAQLSTYAYVNPAVAVLLGWLILGERLSAMQLAGMAVILVSVLAVNLKAMRRKPA